MSPDFHDRLRRARERAIGFVDLCRIAPAEFSLIPNDRPSPYSRSMGIYLLALLDRLGELDVDARDLAARLRADVRLLFGRRCSRTPLLDKPLMQALTFTLSALSVLESIEDDPLEDLISPILPPEVDRLLKRMGALDGCPQSGNLAMFVAIILIHARDYLGRNTDRVIDDWVSLHLAHMNRFGFWGNDSSMTHLQFQNGYHQYEILDYLRVDNPRLKQAKEAVAALADADGHFAPYPGGGGCFDYDAVFILTSDRSCPSGETVACLERTANSIMSEQGADGGFCESRWIRPRTPRQSLRFAAHVVSAWRHPRLFSERLRYAITLQRPKHGRVHGHWSDHDYGWGNSDLWNTWFRMLALARIDVVLNREDHLDWGFLNYPGLGYHRGLFAEVVV